MEILDNPANSNKRESKPCNYNVLPWVGAGEGI